MRSGDWYKKFGSSESRHDTVETYYHVVEVAGDRLFLDEYDFYVHFERLIKKNKTPLEYDLKTWLEENIQNNVYEVPREKLPFYIVF